MAIKPMMGTFEEENKAYSKLMFLTWLMPSLVIVASLLDATLLALTMTVFHPWRNIVKEVS